MAIVKQELFVIRDKVENQLMPGAKGQLAFDTVGFARKSLVHSCWWPHFKKYDTVRDLMPNGNPIVDEFEHLSKLRREEHWDNRDPLLLKALNTVDNEIQRWIRSTGTPFHTAVAKIKFDKQTRYAVESLVLIETKPLQTKEIT